MKRFIIATLLSVLFINYLSAENLRIVSSVNQGWKFSKGDFADAQQQGFDDSKWDNVSVPHTWNKDDADDEIPGFYRGTGWYRRSVIIPAEQKGKQIYISFDGVNQETELFINGKSAGNHLGGYTRFCFDITRFVNVGQQNLLAVKVSNRYNENIPPLSADFTFYGGIYRDVNLIYTEKQHISTTYYGSPGVFIKTPIVTDKEASVNIRTIINNDDNSVQNLRIENIILSPKAEIVLSKSSLVKVAAMSELSVEQNDLKLTTPMLWSPDSPSLYKVITRVIDAKTNKQLDEQINPLGLRWYEFNAEKGFFLNGKHLKLIGTNRHQCFLNMGYALPDEIHIRDIKLLKEMGGNFLRVSHYPQDHVIMEMCDKLGIICSVEIPVVNTITENEPFTNNCLTMAREMVMQDFNRPSVLIWAYMNEVLLRLPFIGDSARNTVYFKSVGSLAAKIEKQIRQDDTARYTLIPCHGNLEAYMSAGLSSIPKIIGFNLYQGWYGGNFSGCDKFLEIAKQKVPGKPFIISEYGADVDPRLHSFSPLRFDYTQEYANLYHEHYIKTIQERPWISGANIWNLNDFYSEGRSNAVPHVNNKGIVSLDREKKDTYLQYQAMLLKTPVISIGGMNWKIRGGNADEKGECVQPVKVYSNQSVVELMLNGKSLGTQAVVDNIAQFNVPFTNGLNKLEASAKTETGVVRDELNIDFRAIPFNLKDTKQPFTELNVMLGSKRLFEDKIASVIWTPEKEYTPGSWGYIGGKSYSKKTKSGTQPASDLDILGTTNDPVYQTARMGLTDFKLDVPDGKYTVSLYWAELQSDKEIQALAYNLGNDAVKEDFSKREFDVELNGITVLNSFNLTKEFGAQTAVVKKFEVDATNGQGITISFKKGVGETLLNAVRVYRNY
ncbi:MAG: glycoside hydrolase family 2 TIM barrel-domain containing protein [Paludibacter sp.]